LNLLPIRDRRGATTLPAREEVSMLRRWTVWMGALAIATSGAAVHAAEVAQRDVLGSLRVTGAVESTLDVEAWHTTTGGAVVAGMAVRTVGEGSVAVAQMSNGDLIGLAANSRARFEAGIVYAEQGKVAFRLRPGSTLEVATPRGVVRAPGAQLVATGGSLREGMVTVTDEGTSVQGYRGTSEMTGPDGEVILIEAGQVASFAEDANAAKVHKAATLEPADPKKEGGYLDWFPSILGLTPTESAALLGIGVGIAGAGAAAGVVASDSGSDDDSDASASGGGGGGAGGGGDGSPFRTTR
jgi:hypothetical protein